MFGIAASAETRSRSAVHDLPEDEATVVAADEQVGDVASLDGVGLVGTYQALAFDAAAGAKQGHSCG